MKKLKTYFLLLAAYFLLAVLFTWPLATRLTTHGFGYDEDSPYQIWHNWWFKYSIFNLKQNPLTTDYIFHPQKVNLIYDANAFVFSALTLPLQFLTNNVVLSSNIVFLLSFALSGLFAFGLTYSLMPSAFPAFISGFIFAFNPYTTAQAIDGHTNLTSTWLIPLYTLLLIKSLKGFNPNRVKPYWPAIAAGIIAALQLYNDFTYTAFMIIETFLIFLYFLVAGRSRLKETLARIFVSGFLLSATAGLLSFPLLSEVMKASKEGFRAGSPLWVQNIWSADLLTLIRPNDQTTFLNNPWTPNIGTVEGTAFLGYGVLLVLIVHLTVRFILWLKNSLVIRPSLWIFLSLSFFVLMLGPAIHFRNSFQFSVPGSRFILPLPYLLLHKIPFIGETQEPARLFPFFILPTAILIVFALKSITRRLSKLASILLLTSYFLLLVFEYLTIPFPATDLSSKPIFDVILNDPEKKAVLVLPLGFNSGNYVLGQSPIGSLQFYQVYHQKPSFRATVARLPYSYFEYYQKLPLMPYLIDPESQLKPEDRDSERARKIFKEQLQIKYILVFEKKYKKSMGETYKVLNEVLGAKIIYDQDGVKGYAL